MGRTIVQFDKDDLDRDRRAEVRFPRAGRALDGAACVRLRSSAHGGAARSMYELPYDNDPSDVRTHFARRHGRHIPDRESRADLVDRAHTTRSSCTTSSCRWRSSGPGPSRRSSCVRTRGGGGAGARHICIPGWNRFSSGRMESRSSRNRRWRSRSRLGGYTGGEADELRRTMGNIRKQQRLEAALVRLHGRMVANEKIAPRVTSGVARAVRRPAELRELRISGIACLELCAHRICDGVSQGALSRRSFICGILNAWPMGFYSPATLDP